MTIIIELFELEKQGLRVISLISQAYVCIFFIPLSSPKRNFRTSSLLKSHLACFLWKRGREIIASGLFLINKLRLVNGMWFKRIIISIKLPPNQIYQNSSCYQNHKDAFQMGYEIFEFWVERNYRVSRNMLIPQLLIKHWKPSLLS